MSIFAKRGNKRAVALVVLDGFGVAPPSKGNAIFLAKTPVYDRMLQEYPHSELIASGESVGLPANEVGNTEVGHLTMGVGRVIYQDLSRISRAMKDGSINTNQALSALANHCKQYASTLHLMGLVSDGNVHSSLEHLYGILQYCERQQVNSLVIHAFTDGRDSHPESGVKVLEQLELRIGNHANWHIGSVMGRYYAMDRDRRWERIQSAYEALVAGVADKGSKVTEVLSSNYAAGVTDEFIKPTLITGKDGHYHTIADNDGVLFFNFRVDRPKELTTAFVLRDFETFRSFSSGFDADGRPVTPDKQEFEATFQRSRVPANVYFVTLTQYHKNLPVSAVAFLPQVVTDSLPSLMGAAGLTHLHLAESEKERFVKYYYNGMVEGALPGEVDDIVASPKVATYDKKPQMSLKKTTKKFVQAMESGRYDHIIMNVANPDMVAHTGNIKATVRAIEYVDRSLGLMEQATLKAGGILIITADHGNAEDLLTFENQGYFYTADAGGVNTEHSNNPVPVIFISQTWRGQQIRLRSGALADLAPTILQLLQITPPETMTGRNILQA
jgi:2,3-bisphosphoglycerate-independent phosphoglycerate mutase